MAGNEARLTDGQRWSVRQFLDHYSKPSASGMPTPVAGPPAPVNVDMSWYMEDGPGRYYHPGMFPVMDQIVDNRNLAPGTYDLTKLVADEDALKARVSHYGTDVRSTDYPLRAIAFGNESARISGEVVVNPDGSKVFRKIEIKPLDTNFDFEHNTKNPLIEGSRAVGRQILDPGDYGSKYEIQYRGYGRPGESDPDRGIGRIYHPFTDAQLSAARRKEFAYPGSAPSGLLPSFTAAPPPAIKEHLQYLDQANAGQAQATGASAAMPPFGSPANTNSWQSLAGASGGTQAQQRLLPPWVFFGPP
jgi:hypothetical protein